MRISPINNRQNQVSHKAVNQKFLKQARDNFLRCYPHHNQGHLLTMIDIRETYGLLSTQDAIDTLEAIKPYSSDALEVIEDMIKSMKESISNQ